MTQSKYSALAAFGTTVAALLWVSAAAAQPSGVDGAVARSNSGEALPEPGELFEQAEQQEDDSGETTAPDRVDKPSAPEPRRPKSGSTPEEPTSETSNAPDSHTPTSSATETSRKTTAEEGEDSTKAASRESAPSREMDPTGGASTPEEPEVRTLRRSGEPSPGGAASKSAPTVEEPSASDDRTADESSPESLFRVARRLFEERAGDEMNLAPYVDDPRWNRAMQQVVDNKCKKALDRIDTILEKSDRNLRSVPAVRYAIARAKMCGGQPTEGTETMRALAGEEGVVAELAQRRLGHEPERVVSEGDGSPTLREQLGEARQMASEGRLQKAVANLAELKDNLDEAWQRYKVRMTEANLLLRDGEVDAAGRELLGVYEMARDWSVGDHIAEKIERIERRHGKEFLPFGARVDRMRELIHRGEYHKAKQVSIRNAKIAGVGEPEITGWSLFRRGLQAERQRRRHEAVEMFERAERLVESPVIRSRLYFGWARALRRIDRDSEAIGLYERLCREYPRHRLCDDARFEAGLLHQYHGEHDQARALFADVVGLHPESELVPKALWRGALSAYLQGDYEAVDRPLKQILEYYPDGRDASGLPVSLKARYWLGAAAFKRGDMELAKRRLQTTINRGALTWYGRLAAQRMRRVGEQPVVPLPPSDLTNRKLKDLSELDLPDSDRYRVAVEYARLGLFEDAIEEMERQLGAGAPPPKAHRFLANLHLVNGDVAKAHWMMHERIGTSTPTWQNLRDWGIAYPVDYMEHGHRYGAKFGVSPFLVQGIMRQESGFRPRVSSYVGAVGLMQVMPGTANTVMDDFFNGEYVSRTELQQPAVNVRLGTAYIRALIAWTDGNIPMALAGYNAGPAPLESWLERYGEREVDAWVESITYQQARGYVRKVYTSYVRYAAIYGGELPAMSFELPDKFGKWGNAPELDGSADGEKVTRVD